MTPATTSYTPIMHNGREVVTQAEWSRRNGKHFSRVCKWLQEKRIEGIKLPDDVHRAVMVYADQKPPQLHKRGRKAKGERLQ